ncbi:pentapeptide repeat-containing protein [Streptomyces sp. NPDC003642]
MSVLITSLVAVVGLWYSNVQTRQANDQARQDRALAKEAQVTDRFTAAVNNLGEDQIDQRLGGIYALQRIMQDSARDQPTIANVLATYVRTRTAKPPAKGQDIPADVQAALIVLTTRDTTRDKDFVLDLRKAWLPKAEIDRPSVHAQASNAYLPCTDPDAKPAIGWDTGGAHLSGADLSGVHLTGAHLFCADLSRAHLMGADLRDAVVSRANLNDANLSGADLRDTNLGHADLRGAVLVGADLRSALLGHANLRGAHLRDADLRSALLGHADLRDALLGGADLAGADPFLADLRGADLGGADLRDTNLAGADLRDTNLGRADLRGAVLTDADLDGVDLRGVKNLSKKQLDSADTDEKTRLPAGLS